MRVAKHKSEFELAGGLNTLGRTVIVVLVLALAPKVFKPHVHLLERAPDQVTGGVQSSAQAIVRLFVFIIHVHPAKHGAGALERRPLVHQCWKAP